MKTKIRSIIALLIVAVLIFSFSGCKEKKVDTPDKTSSTVEMPKDINPLTGLEMDPAASMLRPVALMINNVSVAQEVQTGVDKADIVYELYAEGGITRLLAVYKDPSKVGNIGTIRSARYSHISLAMGHDALYIHAGANKTKAVPLMEKTGLDNFNLLEGSKSKYGFRVKNGKSSEHTLYTSGEKLNEGFKALEYRRELKSASKMWQAFSDKELKLTEGECTEVSVTMSGASNTTFKYNAETGRYTRYRGTTERKDYNTGKPVTFKNILVLKTTLTNTGDSKGVVLTDLVGGEGYYMVNGTYQSVKWKKGDHTDPLKVTAADGSELAYNKGNTWVCLVDKDNNVTITPGAAAQTETTSSK